VLIRIRVGHSDTDTLPACPGPGVAALEKAVCFWQAADVWWRLVAEVDRLLRMRMDECPLRSGVASPRRFFLGGSASVLYYKSYSSGTFCFWTAGC
jgi:hypothetical protein